MSKPDLWSTAEQHLILTPGETQSLRECLNRIDAGVSAFDTHRHLRHRSKIRLEADHVAPRAVDRTFTSFVEHRQRWGEGYV